MLVIIRLYDKLGIKVITLLNGLKSPEEYEIELNDNKLNLIYRLYLCLMGSREFSSIEKLMYKT